MSHFDPCCLFWFPFWPAFVDSELEVTCEAWFAALAPKPAKSLLELPATEQRDDPCVLAWGPMEGTLIAAPNNVTRTSYRRQWIICYLVRTRMKDTWTDKHSVALLDYVCCCFIFLYTSLERQKSPHLMKYRRHGASYCLFFLAFSLFFMSILHDRARISCSWCSRWFCQVASKPDPSFKVKNTRRIVLRCITATELAGVRASVAVVMPSWMATTHTVGHGAAATECCCDSNGSTVSWKGLARFCGWLWLERVPPRFRPMFSIL